MSQNSASQKPAPEREPEVVDVRPDSSPYASPPVTIFLEDGPPLIVPSQLIEKVPALSFLCGPDNRLDLPDISGHTGHVLVHYLFTGTYERLKPKPVSSSARNKAEFETSVQVYLFAWEYGLPGLEHLAKNEMRRLSSRMQIVQILDVLDMTYPNPRADDVWFQDYLKSIIKPLVEDPSASLGRLPYGFNQNLPFVTTLLKVIVEIWRAKAVSPTSSPNDGTLIQDGTGELAATHIETKAAINLEHNSANLYDPSSEPGTVIESGNAKESQEKEKEKEAGRKSQAGLACDVAVEERAARKEGKETPTAMPPVSGFTPLSLDTPSTDSLSQDSFDDMHASDADAPSFSYDRVIGIPSTVGAKGYADVRVKNAGVEGIDRLHNICAEKTYINFSTEELRWGHEVYTRKYIVQSSSARLDADGRHKEKFFPGDAVKKHNPKANVGYTKR